MNDLARWLEDCIADDATRAAISSRWRSVRLYAEVARNRRVLERHRPDRVNSVITVCATRCTTRETRENLTERVPLHWPCDEIRDLASVYVDRPGYQKEWGPHGDSIGA